jgi:integrase
MMGSVYRPKYRNKQRELVESQVWWIKFYRNGKPFRESTGKKKKGEAEHRLKIREGEVAEGRFYGLRAEKILLDELAEDLINDYKVNGKKSLDRTEISIEHLKAFFEDTRVADVTTDRINAYIRNRQEQGRSNSTINRELAALKRMFSLGTRTSKVTRTPYIPHLEENNARTGFFTHDEYQALKEAMPDHLKPLIVMAYHTGMRLGELRSLKWGQIDLLEEKITLKAQDTKNKEPRIIYMAVELLEAIRFQKAVRDNKHPEFPLVFSDNHGNPVGRFDKAWKNACKAADLDGKLFHDFRRTAVRNMVRAGVPERVAMMVSGHKTRSVFERYNVVDESDLKKASLQVSEYHRAKSERNKSDGHGLGKVGVNRAGETVVQKAQLH